jgi:deoxyribonuclease IV
VARAAEPAGSAVTERIEPAAPRPRIGVHLSTAGGVFRAAERAHEIGANTFQIFSSSPRMWRQPKIAANHCAQMRELRERFDVSPLVIHASYLINVAAQAEAVWKNSIAALRGELERALALGAEYLVLHPGSWRGLTREAGLLRAAEAIERALDGLAWQECDFRVLIENTAGAEFSLGSNFEQVGELVEKLRRIAPVGACLDTCHCHVAGYDIVTSGGFEETVGLIEQLIGLETVRVWHMNDAKAPRGSKLDRHEHIGEGTIGAAAFRRILNDARFRHCAFVAETPVDEAGDDARNVNVLKSLVGRPVPPK